MLTVLSRAYGALGGSRVGRRLLRTLHARKLSRAWLRNTVLQAEQPRPNDVTVLIGVRNRGDYRITNALKSIRDQTYPSGEIRIIVVDYGSEPPSSQFTADVCLRYRADYVPVDTNRTWSRARCLNVGLRNVDTKFVMTSDTDILLSPRYLADAVAALEKLPLSVICSPMLDLPEESSEIVKQAARQGGSLRLEDWKKWSTPRFTFDFHPSIAVTHTAFFRLIRGYDEYYEGWGSEDDDLMRRFGYLGLQPEVLGPGSFYLHQWHPKFQGITEDEQASLAQRNTAHFEGHHSILRNDRKWGRVARRLQPRLIL